MICVVIRPQSAMRQSDMFKATDVAQLCPSSVFCAGVVEGTSGA